MWTYRVVKMDIEQAQVHRSLARPVLLGGGADRAPMIIRDNPVRHRTWTRLSLSVHPACGLPAKREPQFFAAYVSCRPDCRHFPDPDAPARVYRGVDAYGGYWAKVLWAHGGKRGARRRLERQGGLLRSGPTGAFCDLGRAGPFILSKSGCWTASFGRIPQIWNPRARSVVRGCARPWRKPSRRPPTLGTSINVISCQRRQILGAGCAVAPDHSPHRLF